MTKFLSTPQPLILSNQSGVSSFFATTEPAARRMLHGAVVTSPDAPGSVAYVAACNGWADEQKTKRAQRILMTLQSPKTATISGTLELTADETGSQEFAGLLGGLALSVIPSLLGSDIVTETHLNETAQQTRMIPLLIGPSSVSQAAVSEEPTEELAGILGALASIAATVVPVIAPVAIDVAQQLLAPKTQQDIELEQLGFDFGSIVGDIVKVAAPVAGAALTELSRRL